MNTSTKIKTLEFKLSKLLNGGLFGLYKSRLHGNGMEFAEHREYNYGDSVKNIDWKTSNKTGKMFIKNYEEEKDLNVLFILDNTSSMKFGSQNKTKIDSLIETFYMLSFSAYSNNDNIGGIIFDDNGYKFLDYKKSKTNIYGIINELYNKGSNYISYKDNIGTKIEVLLKDLIKRNIRNNLIFILTDDSEFTDLSFLKVIGLENDVVFINIFDVLENDLSILKGQGTLSLGKLSYYVDLTSNKKVDLYKSTRSKKIEILSTKLRKNNIGYIKIDNKSDIFTSLLGYFNKVNK